MKDKKTAKIDIRVTKEEKDLIKAYCEKYDIKMSQLIRETVRSLIERSNGE